MLSKWKGEKKEGNLKKIYFYNLTCLRENSKTLFKYKILHFQKHGLILRTYKMRAMFLEMQNCSICSSLRIFPSQVLNFCTTIFKESIISNNSFLSLSIKQSNAFIILGFLLLIEYYQITKLQISFKKSQNSNKYTYEKRLKPKFYLHLHLDLCTFFTNWPLGR